MAVKPLRGRCRRCGGGFILKHMAAEPSGLCPKCGHSLAPEWTDHMREHVALAEQAQLRLVKSLERLRSLPGNLEIIPSSVLDNVIGEVGWERSLVGTPDLVASEAASLRSWADKWASLNQGARSRPRRRVAGGLDGRRAKKLAGPGRRGQCRGWSKMRRRKGDFESLLTTGTSTLYESQRIEMDTQANYRFPGEPSLDRFGVSRESGPHRMPRSRT